MLAAFENCETYFLVGKVLDRISQKK
jgi:hypothetical protein